MKNRILIGLALALSLGGCGSGSSDDANTSPIGIQTPVTQYTIGGTVAGLAAGKQVLIQNGDDALTVTADGAFTFAKKVTAGGGYNVGVQTQPDGQTCTVTRGQGSGVNADVSSVGVTCSTKTYLVSGTVSGLAAGRKVTLANNGGDTLEISADGNFAFATSIAHGSGYNVTVTSQPADQTCTVTGYNGAGVTANVSSVQVLCSTNGYRVGGVLKTFPGGSVTFQLNGAETKTLTAAGPFTFNTSVAQGGSYNVTVFSQSAGIACSTVNASRSNIAADVSDIEVMCSTASYPLSGTVSGLASGQQLTLVNNGTDGATVGSNVTFQFPSLIPYLGTYNVSILTQPALQTCTVIGGTGVVSGPSSFSVLCADKPAYVYVTNQGENTISQFLISSDGTLVPLATPKTTTVMPRGLAIAPKSKRLFVAAATNSFMSYPILGSGEVDNNFLTAYPTGFLPTEVAVLPQENFAYALNVGEGAISVFALDASGDPGPSTMMISTGAGNLTTMAAHASGKYIFVTRDNNTIGQYIVNPDGSLTPTQNAFTLGAPRSIALHNSGKWGLVGTGLGVQPFIASTDGTVAITGTISGGSPTAPYSVATSPTASYAYVAGDSENGADAFGYIQVYLVDETTVTASQVGLPVKTGLGPRAIAVDPSGRYVYVLNNFDRTISQYRVLPSGVLSPLSPATVPTGVNPTGIVAGAL